MFLAQVQAESQVLVALVQFVFPISLLLLAMFTGRHFENKHIKSLDEAESELGYFVVTNSKYPVGPIEERCNSSLVEGQVVIANDYLKSFLSQFRMIFGGEMKNYDRLMMRARREAMVRLLRDAQSLGYDAVCNVRMDFSSIVSGSKNKAPAVEVLVTGTAYKQVKN